ncbi:phosphoglycolate phosphatase [Acinetobacter sp. S40]|uniref:phosphoglycolate phosphatase n=1 Tax=Acinetobacter sp. S40 TaxID=2767434 RepID=UPI00190C1A29|nr:phosphoglycolate phosphatase [Acinetobacter sp. S40]MBJ9986494.1 phosphoglycolate phosphatase [Acinetobacter sp. S40]
MSLLQLEQRKLILFDLDGTLVDTASDMYRSMNLSLQQLGWAEVTEAQVRQWVGQGTGKLCDAVLRFLFGQIEPEKHQQLLEKYLEVYAQELCVHSRLFEGVQSFLDVCKKRHIDMACVTNKPKHLAKELLQKLGVDHYFKLVVGGDSLPLRKPDPLPLLHSMQVFKTTQLQTLMVGDSKNDIEAARRAGIDCIVVSYGYNHGENIYDSDPQQVVDRLDQLLV